MKENISKTGLTIFLSYSDFKPARCWQQQVCVRLSYDCQYFKVNDFYTTDKEFAMTFNLQNRCHFDNTKQLQEVHAYQLCFTAIKTYE